MEDGNHQKRFNNKLTLHIEGHDAWIKMTGKRDNTGLAIEVLDDTSFNMHWANAVPSWTSREPALFEVCTVNGVPGLKENKTSFWQT